MKARLLSALGFSLCLATVQAQIIWDTPQNISGDTDVITTGILVNAFNIGPSNVPQTTLNGVPFEPFVFSYNVNPVSLGNYKFSEDYTYLYAASDAGYAGPPYTGLSEHYMMLLSSYGASGAPNTLSLEISGLAPGQTYLFQWWNNYSIASGNTYNTTATAGNAVMLDANLTDLDGGLGQFVTGVFTAGEMPQVIDFTGEQYPLINAFQIRAIPEPSTYAALAGMGTLVLAVFRRRKY